MKQWNSDISKIKAIAKIVDSNVNEMSFNTKEDVENASKLASLTQIISSRAAGQRAASHELHDEITNCKEQIDHLMSLVKEKEGNTAENYDEYKVEVDNLFYRQNYYLKGLLRLDTIEKILDYKEKLHTRLDIIDESHLIVSEATINMVKDANNLDTIMLNEPHSSWQDFWTNSKHAID